MDAEAVNPFFLDQLVRSGLGHNAFTPEALALIVKESYWRWPQRNLQGNVIDFQVQILGLNFHNAMRQIIGF